MILFIILRSRLVTISRNSPDAKDYLCSTQLSYYATIFLSLSKFQKMRLKMKRHHILGNAKSL